MTRGVLALAWCLGTAPIAAAQLVTDTQWKVAPTEAPGWTTLEFDDSGWRTADGPHPDAWSGGQPIAWTRDASAIPLWSGREEPSAFLRRVFEVPADAPRPAIAYVEADDDYVLYVNGERVAENRDRQLTVPGEAYDVTTRLHPGRNVVAIQGIDTGFGEHVLFALHFGVAEAAAASAPAERAAETAAPANRAAPTASAPPTRPFLASVDWIAVCVLLAIGGALAWMGATRTFAIALPAGLGVGAIALGILAVHWTALTRTLDESFGAVRFVPAVLPHAPALSVALLLLLAGGLIVASRTMGDAPAPPSRSASSAPWRTTLRALWPVLGLLVALSAANAVSVVLAIRRAQGFDRLVPRWLVALAAAALAAWIWDRARRRGIATPLTRREWAACAALTLAAIALYAFDLASYRYAFIGDEFAFFTVARDLARGTMGWDNLFSEEGIWGYQPRLSSAYQALVMQVFGASNFGWRMSSVLAAALALPPCFVFLRTAFSARAAWFGTAALGLSHFALTFAHIGYNNNHVILPTIACLALLAVGARSGSALAFVGSGIAAGLGFYTFYTSRLAIGFAALFVILHFARGDRRAWLARAGWIALGFGLTVAPAVAEPQRFLENMRRQSVFATPEGTPAPCWSCVTPQQEERIARNTAATLASPVLFRASSHFVSGSLVDAVTAALFAVGLAAALLLATRGPQYPFLAAVFLSSALVLGVSTPYDEPPATRMLFMVLPACLLAGVGADRLLDLLPARRARAALLVLVAAVAALNLHRVYVAAPRDNGIHTEALVVRYLQHAPAGTRRYYLLPDEWGAELIVLHLEIYGLEGGVEVLHFRDVRAAPERLRTPCEVLFNQDVRERRDETIAWLEGTHPGATRERLTDPSGQNEMLVLRLP